jgi:hypothetical protein
MKTFKPHLVSSSLSAEDYEVALAEVPLLLIFNDSY